VAWWALGQMLQVRWREFAPPQKILSRKAFAFGFVLEAF
jgi:hypothetical protein